MNASNPPTRAPVLIEAPGHHPSDTETWTFCRVQPSALGNRVRTTVRRVLSDSGIPDDPADLVLAALDDAWGAPGTQDRFRRSVPDHLETCLHEEEWGFWAVLEDDSVARTPLVRRSDLRHHLDELSLVSRLAMERITGASSDGFYSVTVGAFVEPGTDPGAVNSAIARDLRLSA